MNNSFENKVVLITGGTSGIGESVARHVAALKAKVIISGRHEVTGNAVAQSINEGGGIAVFHKADTSVEEDVSQLVEFTLSQFGRLDYAFNNAGVGETPGLTIDKETEQNYRHIFDINVLGVLLSMKYEIPAMLKSGGGSIVNTSSVAGLVGLPGVGVYVASKHAVIGLTRTAALEFAKQGIRVNAVAPGVIETPMLKNAIGEETSNNRFLESIKSTTPIGRIGTVDEVSKAVIGLLENGYITGSVLTVDGGWTAH
jgi:NAD(P)-dependent dehydrogenase (short-subunit alcohol dehydrogenase family)